MGLVTRLEISKAHVGPYVGVKYVLPRICGHYARANEVGYLKASFFREGSHTMDKFVMLWPPLMCN